MDITAHPHRIPIYHAIAAWLASHSQQAWVAGGAVRDALVRQPGKDLDLVLAGDVPALANAMAPDLHATVARIADDTPVMRLAFEDVIVDLAALRGADIYADLATRDFTCNALALPLTPESLIALIAGDVSAIASALIDPFDGRADVAAGMLRVTTPAALRNDPLRVLRAARLATALGWRIAPETRGAARAVAGELTTIAPERITAELFVMLAAPQATAAMNALDDLGALTVLVPPLELCRGMVQGRLHYWDVLQHSLEVIDSVDRVVGLLEAGRDGAPPAPEPDDAGDVPHPTAIDLAGHNGELLARLHLPLAHGQTRLTTMKMAALFHDIGKPLTRVVREDGAIFFPSHAEAGVPLTAPVLQSWKLSSGASRYIQAIVACHMRPGQIAGPHGLSDKAARHYYRDAGDAGIDVAIFSLADHLAVYGPRPLTWFWPFQYGTVIELVRRAIEEPERVIPRHLVDGNDLIAHLEIPAGPALRYLLDRIDAAQLDGEIQTHAEALALARQLLAGM
jgi:poly(A) polymerase